MEKITYYVALAFARGDDGSLRAEESVECPNRNMAIGRARAMARDRAGAVAFSRTGAPELGEFAPAVVIATFGVVSEDLSEL